MNKPLRVAGGFLLALIVVAGLTWGAIALKTRSGAADSNSVRPGDNSVHADSSKQPSPDDDGYELFLKMVDSFNTASKKEVMP